MGAETNEPVTDRSEDIRARWEAATPGPWAFNGYSAIVTPDAGYDAWESERLSEGHSLDLREGCTVCEKRQCDFYTEDYDREPIVAHVPSHHGDTAIHRRVSDAEAIANAPEDVAWLLAEVERRDRAMDGLRTGVENILAEATFEDGPGALHTPVGLLCADLRAVLDAFEAGGATC